jgi:hypothetical protein
MRPGGPAPERVTGAVDARPAEIRRASPVDTIAPPVAAADGADRLPAPDRAVSPLAEAQAVPLAASAAPDVRRLAEPAGHGAVAETRPVEASDGRPACTTAQLRRFIKSRPWVPMHELRRRFGIWGGDDEVSPMRVAERTLFVGLPAPEASMIAELLSGGDVGYELSLDPVTPIVVGVYPMRPVPRS